MELIRRLIINNYDIHIIIVYFYVWKSAVMVFFS